MAKPRVVKARSWSELPEVLEPGVYYVDGERFVIYEPVERDVWRGVVAGIKKLHKKYYER